MSDDGAALKPGREMAGAFRSLVEAPFMSLTLLDVLLAVVSASIASLIGPDGVDDNAVLLFSSGIFFAVTATYLQIAITLAAAGSGGSHGADPWIKAALRQRCFWRYIGVSLLSALAILIGAVFLIVGAVVVGSLIVLSQAAVVLERKLPGDALRRSAELAKPARREVGVIFVVLWLPPLIAQVLLQAFTVELDFAAEVALGVVSTILGVVATIAVTRAFVRLGGAPAPPLQTLLYKERAG